MHTLRNAVKKNVVDEVRYFGKGGFVGYSSEMAHENQINWAAGLLPPIGCS